jgi:predicted nucleic acid-binding protein
MARGFVLDCGVLVGLIAGQKPAGTVIPTLLEMDLAGTTTVTVYELCCRAARSSGRQLLDRFLPTLTIFPLDARSAQHAGAVNLSHRRKGQPIKPGDSLIARICLARDLALPTRNISHFRWLANVKVVTLEELFRCRG